MDLMIKNQISTEEKNFQKIEKKVQKVNLVKKVILDLKKNQKINLNHFIH